MILLISLKSKTCFIHSVLFWGVFLLCGAVYAQNASSVSTDTGSTNNSSLQQSEISEIVRVAASRQSEAEGAPKATAQLSAREIEKNRRIDALVRKLQKKDERQIDLSKKVQDLVVKLQPETNKILKRLTQERQAAIKEARNKNLQEQRKELDRINAENRKKMEKYFRDAVKNLPQKGRHKDYTAYNKRFQPIVRK